MSKYRGTIKRSDLEGGRWELHAEDGEVYDLDGAPAAVLKHGQRVEVDGKVDRDAMSIGMRGAVLRVKAAKAV